MTIILAGCPESTSTSDMAAPSGDMALRSACGKPGDTAVNSKGVGKFCISFDECTTNSEAKLCSSIGNVGGPLDTYFCTVLCSSPDAGTSVCGDNAHCQCDPGGRGCACTPNRCM
jgi:hypothetical protein